MHFFVTSLLLLCALLEGEALPTGAPVDACSTLTPQHGGVSATECGVDCPFSLNLVAIDDVPVTSNEYRCGAQHTCELSLRAHVCLYVCLEENGFNAVFCMCLCMKIKENL